VSTLDFRRVRLAIAAVVVVFVAGTAGFEATLHEGWMKSFYRTVVTATLTGLDTVPKNTGAELITVALVLAGVGIFAYVAAVAVEAIASGILGEAWKEKRRRRMIEELRDHIIVCGYGRVGRRCGEEFRVARVPYVVLDFSEDAIAAAREDDVLFVVGSGTEDEDLERAGLLRARGVIAASDSDADNLYITLSAKSRRAELVVIARATDEDAERKLKLAGADRVVTPYATAGRVMANLMLKPQIAAFVNVLTSAQSPELNFEEIEVRSDCGAAGRSIRDLDVFERTGAYVVAVRKRNGSFDTRPSKETVLETGDTIVGVGAPDEIRALETLFQPNENIAH
jgi:voltage-gated potassium channel